MPEKTILIADDDPAILQLIELVFREEGWGVITARNGQEALDAVAENTPLVAIIDLRMPVVDGQAVVAKLRRSETTKHMPIIAISAERTTASQELKADAFLAKPFEIDELVHTVKHLLNGGARAWRGA